MVSTTPRRSSRRRSSSSAAGQSPAAAVAAPDVQEPEAMIAESAGNMEELITGQIPVQEAEPVPMDISGQEGTTMADDVNLFGRPVPVEAVPELDHDDGYRAFLEATNAKSKNDLDGLERQLEIIIDNLWQCAVVVENFSDASQEKVFHANVRKFMDDLNKVSEISSKIDVEVPIRVLIKVDSGGNPDTVTKELADVCRSKNDATRGRVFSTRIFRDIFQAKINAWNERDPLG